jgi:hypothetical protein
VMIDAFLSIAASVALLLLGLEVAVHIANGVPLTPIHNFVTRRLNAVHGTGGFRVHDPLVGWITRPNFTFERRGKHFVFGEHGARMSSHELVPLQQGAILLVGNSFGMGGEVDNNESWPAQLERMIGVQVINAAVSGYGLDQTVLRAEELAPKLKPRMILVQARLAFGISVNRMSLFGGAPKPYFMARHGQLVLANVPVPRAATSRDIGWLRLILAYSYLVHHAMTRLELLQWWISPAMADRFVLSNSEAVEVTCLLMRRLAELRDRHQVPVVLVFQYGGHEAMSPALPWEADRSRIISCAEIEKIEIIDELEALRSYCRAEGEAAYRGLWILHDNDQSYGHMSPAGNRLIAQLVQSHLASRGAVQSGCGRSH